MTGEGGNEVQLPYRFGRAELRPVERELLVDGRPATLGTRALDLLLVLVERRERTVTKNELLDLVWPGLVVEENNLHVHVSALRRLLGPQAIATIPGRGYKFALPLDRDPAVSPPVAAPDTALVRDEHGPLTTNLPAELAPLYGRDAEAGEVAQLLEQHRLISIVGPGGIGKSRLAQEVAHQLRDRFRDGVWLVELADISDPARVAGTVAQTFNMPVGDPASAIDAAIDALRGKDLLLLLDNCEHLLVVVSALATAIRRSAPSVTAMTTSQEPLKVPDEHVYRLDTLAVPARDTTYSLQAAAACGAVALFTARAKAADPRFRLNAGNVDTVVDVCRRLDGIALALELAAARVPLLGVEGLRGRLDERLNVLTRGSRTALARHQTLRAALEWSHSLLSDAERRVFRRLAVFVRGFTLEAAQQVARDEALDTWQVLDHLGALVEKSLVAVDTGDPPRYHLLETSRAYALERLALAGEAEAFTRRHAQACAALFEAFYAQRWHGRPFDFLGRFRPELDNLRAALDWSSRNDFDLEVALTGAGAWLWNLCGLRLEAIAVCERARLHLSATTPEAHEARLLSELTWVGRLAIPSARALQALERAAELYRSVNDRVGLYESLVRRAPIFAAVGEMDSAWRVLAEAKSLEDESWPPRLRLQHLWALGIVLRFEGPVEQFRQVQEERCRLARLAESELDELFCLKNLITADVVLGRFDDAIRDGYELAARFRRRGFASQLWLLSVDLATALAMRGSIDVATRQLREGVPLGRRSASLWRHLDLFALIAVLGGRTRIAGQLLGAADALYKQFGQRRMVDERWLHDQVLLRLQVALDPDELARVVRDGGSMSELEAVAAAVADLESRNE